MAEGEQINGDADRARAVLAGQGGVGMSSQTERLVTTDGSFVESSVTLTEVEQ